MKLSKDKLDLCLARTGMTKSELAEKSGVRLSSILHALKSNSNIYPHTAGKLSEALGVDVTELIAN